MENNVKAESTAYTEAFVANQIITYINPQGVEFPGIVQEWSWAANRYIVRLAPFANETDDIIMIGAREDQLSARTA
jgi:hypothetical protein